MKEILDTLLDHSPMRVPLHELFFFPDCRLLATYNQGCSNWAIE